MKGAELLAGLRVDEGQLLASLCKASFADFFREFWDCVSQERLRWNWHLDEMCRVWQEGILRVSARKPRLHDYVTNVPPGTSKSTVFSVLGPAWAWSLDPTLQFLCGSYSERLSLDLSQKCRDVLRSKKYQQCFPHVRVREDQDTKYFFKLERGGWRFATGVGGTATGFHAHVISVDDPLDPVKAVSDLELRQANYWMTHTLSNRKVNKEATVTYLTMQVLHQGDPSREMVKAGGVYHLSLPAELREGGRPDRVSPAELRGKYVGGLLDPGRMPEGVLAQERAKGDYYYAAQFLQDPIPPGGGMFQTGRVTVTPLVPEVEEAVRYWDKAGSQTRNSAFTVGVKMGRARDGSYWVLDVVRGRWDTFTRERKIWETACSDGTGVLVGLEQEPGSGGKESVERTVRMLAGFRCTWLKPSASDGTKVMRADPFSTQVNAGAVFLREAPWNKEYLEELAYFPYSTYKDQVDASAGAFSLLSRPARRAGGLW